MSQANSQLMTYSFSIPFASIVRPHTVNSTDVFRRRVYQSGPKERGR